MNLNSILIGSSDAGRLADYYTTLFGAPSWDQGGYRAWRLGTGFITLGPQDQVSGRNAQPGRLIWNIESADVEADFERLKGAGATIIRAPYHPDAEGSAWIATFSDPDDNYFQLVSPMMM